MTITPSKFLRELLSIVVPAPGQDMPVAWITTFEGDPLEVPNSCWTGWAYDPAKPLPRINGECAYFSVAAFQAGATSRRKDTPHAVIAIVCDDIGTKVKVETVVRVLGEPSFIMETSPGNYQYGYLPDKPLTPTDIEPLESTLKALRATDKSGGSSIRNVRLNAGVNGKAGSKFKVHLVEWHPERRYSLTYFQERLNVATGAATNQKDPTTDLELLAHFDQGENRYQPMMTLSARWAQRGAARDDIEANLYTLLDKAQTGNYQELRRQVPHIAFTAVKKFGDPRADGAGAEPFGVPHDFIHAPAAIPFDATDVPAVIGDYATRWAQHAGYDRTGVIAACVVTAAASLHDGIRLEVQSQTNWYESARLWAALIAPPGFAKSPMINTGVAPLQDIHKVELDSHAEEFERWAATQEGKKEGTARDPPPRPATFTNDCTIEKLSEILSDNEGGILYIAPELDSWLGSHDAYRAKGGGERDRGEWLQLFDGGPHAVDRVRRGSFYVPNWGVSLISATTPAALQKLADKLPNDGLLQRILPFMIAMSPEPDHSIMVSTAAKKYQEIIQTIHGYSKVGPATEVESVSLTVDARALLDPEVNRYRALAPAAVVINEGLAGHLAKYGSLLARLALTFHAIDCADRKISHPTNNQISLAIVSLAAKFLKKSFTHARALYRDLAGSDTALNVAHRVALAIVADGLKVDVAERPTTIDRRNLIQRYEMFRKAELAVQTAAMQLLVDFAWVRLVRGKYEKGYATCWEINPAIYDKFRADGEEWLRRRTMVKDAIMGGTS